MPTHIHFLIQFEIKSGEPLGEPVRPVKAELAATPAEWKASGVFYKANNVTGLVDFIQNDRQRYVKLLPPLSSGVSRLLPPAQLNTS